MTIQCNWFLINIKGLQVFTVIANTFFSRRNISENIGEWQKLYESKEPQSFPLPEEFNNTLHELQKMIILRCLRPDKVNPSVIKCS